MLMPGKGCFAPIVDEELVCLGLNAVAGIDVVLAGSLLVGERLRVCLFDLSIEGWRFQ